MKHLITLLIASCLIGLAFYAIMYFAFGIDKHIAISSAISAAVAGIVVEYLRPYFNELHEAQKDRIHKRIRRHLKHFKGSGDQSTEP